MSRDPGIDGYIAKAKPFARPILEKVRERLHALVPDIEEAIKWSHPTYSKGGKLILGTSAFKEHVSVHFWRGQELGLASEGRTMGQLGRLTSVDELPADLDAIIARAAEMSEAPARPKPKNPPKPMPDPHPDFAKALDNSPAAKAVFDAFAPSHRREYLEWISDAKQEATRQKRIATAIEWLSEGKRRNWKYENC